MQTRIECVRWKLSTASVFDTPYGEVGGKRMSSVGACKDHKIGGSL